MKTLVINWPRFIDSFNQGLFKKQICFNSRAIKVKSVPPPNFFEKILQPNIEGECESESKGEGFSRSG